ncbi:MAG: hypothetical protein IJR54_02310 [Oscillibacter sp.]|nr:hypothetical protein [Oscillibacter sp.]
MYENLGEWAAITEEQYAAVLRWVESGFVPRKTMNYDRHLNRIKRVFKSRPDGFFVHDDILCDAMVACGYCAKRSRSGQWFFNISEKSPAIREWLQQIHDEAPKERHIWIWR